MSFKGRLCCSEIAQDWTGPCPGISGLWAEPNLQSTCTLFILIFYFSLYCPVAQARNWTLSLFLFLSFNLHIQSPISIARWLSNFSMHQNYLVGLLKYKLHGLSFRVSGIGSENLNFQQIPKWCCWFRDHILKTTGVDGFLSIFHIHPFLFLWWLIWVIMVHHLYYCSDLLGNTNQLIQAPA